uniref:Uncharacterized protein n=1 Tax=Oryzias latipes TaxID=8090 RepID=A0A3P9JJG5_ORYLA
MRRVVSENKARHCSSVTSFSAASTTFFTMALLTGMEWSELTRPSKILSMMLICRDHWKKSMNGNRKYRSTDSFHRKDFTYDEKHRCGYKIRVLAGLAKTYFLVCKFFEKFFLM